MTEEIMIWPKPNRKANEDGNLTLIANPHPKFIFENYINRKPHDMVDSFVEEALRFYLIMTCINGITKEMAFKLAQPENYRLVIDEETDPENYILTIVEVKE